MIHMFTYWGMSIKVNSVQEPCAKCFVVHILKFEISQTTWKNKTKNIKMLDLLIKNWKLRAWCSLFHFFHVILRFQILIREPQRIWRKLLVLSWLYDFWHIHSLLFIVNILKNNLLKNPEVTSPPTLNWVKYKEF